MLSAPGPADAAPGPPPDGAGGAVLAASSGRASVRAFLPDSAPRAVVRRILEAAARAPSGSNLQPWQAYVLTGPAKSALEAELLAAHAAGEAGHAEEYAHHPRERREAHLSRRRKVRWDLHGLLGIGRGEEARVAEQRGRDHAFFGAPVGLVLTVDRALERGSWLDHGFFLQCVAMAARAFGLGTCPQAAFTKYHRVLQARLRIPPGRTVVCGTALGRADSDDRVNALRTERAPVEAFRTFLEEALP